MRTRIALRAAITVMATCTVVSIIIAGTGTGPSNRSPGPAGAWVATSDRVSSGTAPQGTLAVAQAGIEVPSGTAPGGSAGRSLSAELSMANALARVAVALAPPATASTPSSAPAASTPPPASTPAIQPAPTVTTTTAAPPTDATSTATVDWACIRTHESGDRYNSPAAPSGAYGILRSTWLSMGMSGWPYQAAPSTQDAIALELYHRYGWAPWSTRFVCGLG